MNAEAIRERIAALQVQRATMQVTNRLLKKGDDRGLTVLRFDADQIARLKQPDPEGHIGFSPSTIRRVSDRIATLRAKMKSLETAQ